MSPQPETSAPPEMAAEIAGLCAQARQDASCLYGQLLRENVADVLSGSFPGFSGQLGPARLEALVSAFLVRHSATRPQFHHIATEFVEFAQQQLALPPSLMALLEYEWVLLAAEIDSARVTPSRVAAEDLAADARIAMNPTSRLVVLPFDAAREDGPGAPGDGEARCAHAVWRTAAHGVAVQPLTYQDCLLIDVIARGGDAIGLDALVASASGQFSEEEVRQWVARGADRDLLRLGDHE
jgi:uncharacterized protein